MRLRNTFILSILLFTLVLFAAQAKAVWAIVDLLPAPTNLKAVVTEDKKIKISWSSPSDPWQMHAFAIREANQQVSDAKFNGPPSDGNVVYLLPPEGDRYIIGLSYNDRDGHSSNIAYTSVVFGAPYAPVSLKVSDVKWYGTLKLSWTDTNVAETAWVIDVKGTDSQMKPASRRIELPPHEGASVETTITSPLEPEGYYTFTVYAKNGGFVGPSKQVNAAIKMAPPSNLTAEIANDSTPHVDLQWTKNSIMDSIFQIERTNPDGTKTYINEIYEDDHSYDQDVKRSSTYKYRVRAIYESRPEYNSDFSNQVSITIPGIKIAVTPSLRQVITNTPSLPTPPAPVAEAPAAPSQLTATAEAADKVILNWHDNADNETGFKIERDSVVIATVDADVESYSNSALAADTSYIYRVRAYNNEGNSGYSNTASATTFSQTATPPPTPTNPNTPADVEPGENISLRLYIGKTEYYVNGALQNMDTAPIILEGRTLMPIRYVAEPLSAYVGWIAAEQKATISMENKNIAIWIGKNQAIINGHAKYLDESNTKVVPVIVPPGRTMLPLRFIAENLGCEVGWNAALQEVTITYNP